MKSTLAIIGASLLAVATAFGADSVKLEPNAIISFEFPDLSETLATKLLGEKEPARLTAELPDNYTPGAKFPLCVFLGGGHGGRGKLHPIQRAIAGQQDFISVALPLFKHTFDTNEGALVSMDDFDTISHAYQVMLQKLLDAVPNVTPERSAFGGFSNGAHTTAVLLAGQDEFILRNFRSFYFVEGGSPLAANVLQKLVMKRNRFLVLYGDQAKDEPLHEGFVLIARSLSYLAKERQLDLTTIVMRGAGHELPTKYALEIGQWVRGEKLSQTEEK